MKKKQIPSDCIDIVISEILLELDSEIADYQKHHVKYYGKPDPTAAHMYREQVNLCNMIRQRIFK